MLSSALLLGAGACFPFVKFLQLSITFCARIKSDDVLSDTNSIDANYANSTCKNNTWISYIKLSRNSGNLNISTYDLKNKKIEHDTNFQCKIVNKKLF